VDPFLKESAPSQESAAEQTQAAREEGKIGSYGSVLSSAGVRQQIAERMPIAGVDRGRKHGTACANSNQVDRLGGELKAFATVPSEKHE